MWRRTRAHLLAIGTMCPCAILFMANPSRNLARLGTIASATCRTFLKMASLIHVEAILAFMFAFDCKKRDAHLIVLCLSRSPANQRTKSFAAAMLAFVHMFLLQWAKGVAFNAIAFVEIQDSVGTLIEIFSADMLHCYRQVFVDPCCSKQVLRCHVIT